MKKTASHLGTLVSLGVTGTFAEIVEVFQHGDGQLYHAHYIDFQTGERMKCPDMRCNGGHTCPIHGRNITPQGEGSPEYKIVPKRDVTQLQKLGFLANWKGAK